MSIVFLVRSLGGAGAERQLLTLARALHDSGHTVAIVTVRLLEKRWRWDLPGVLWRLIRPSHSRIFRGVRASDIDFSRYDWLTHLTFRVSCRLSRFVDRIIANSWSGAAFHQLQNYPEDRMVVIPNGIDTDLKAAEVLSRNRADVRAEGLRAMLARTGGETAIRCRQFVVENFSLNRLVIASEKEFRALAN